MKTQLAWKVVSVSPVTGILTSAIWYRFVRYQRNRWTVPHKGDNPFLFVFGTRRNARRYLGKVLIDRIENGERFRLCRCKVRNLTTDRSITTDGSTYYTKSLNFPVGTMFADAVKLI